MDDNIWRPTPPPSYCYWQDVWSDYLRSDGVRVTVDLHTLPVVLEDLETQIKLDQLSNRKTRANFDDDFNRISKQTWLYSEYQHLIRAVSKQLKSWQGWRIPLHLVERARKQVDATFPKHCAEKLARIVGESTFTDEHRRHISEISNALIVEFLKRGFSPSFVRGVPAQLAAGYEVVAERLLITDFPNDILYRQESAEVYRAELSSYLKALTWTERVMGILYFINKPKKENRYIFQLRGLRIGDPIQFGRSLIYNPFVTKRVAPDNHFDVDETFGEEDSENLQFPNIEVTLAVHEFDREGAKGAALLEAERHLDLLAAYLPMNAPLVVIPDSYIVIDGDCASGGWSRPDDDPYLHFSNSSDIEVGTQRGSIIEGLQHEAISSYLDPNSQMRRRISLALAAFRRAESTKRAEQRLLDFWMTIETLLDLESWRTEEPVDKEKDKEPSTLTSIIKILIPLYFRKYILNSMWGKLHSLLSNYVVSEAKLPDTIISRCSLRAETGEIIALKPLLNSLDEILNILRERDDAHYLVQCGEDVRQFYFEPKNTIAKIDEVKGTVERELIHIYRARNRLVHSAYDRTLFLGALGEKAGIYARALLNHALEGHPSDHAQLRHSLAKLEADQLALEACLDAGFPLDIDALENEINLPYLAGNAGTTASRPSSSRPNRNKT